MRSKTAKGHPKGRVTGPMPAWSWLGEVGARERADWPAPPASPGPRALVHRAKHWALWDDGALTSTRGLRPELVATSLTADAVGLVDVVWHGAGHASYGAWARLARVERVVEREVLGVRWPCPWEERLERLVVENVDGTREVLFVHVTCPDGRPSSLRAWIGPSLPEGAGGGLDRPEPAAFYDLGAPVFGVSRAKKAPSHLVVRPRAGRVTAFFPKGEGGYVRRDCDSMRAAVKDYRLEPRAVQPVWPFLHDVSLAEVAAIECERWGVAPLAPRPAADGLYLADGAREFGPCTTPWDVASIVAARSRS